MSKVSKLKELRRSKKPAIGTLDPSPVTRLTGAKKAAVSKNFGLKTPEKHLNSKQKGWAGLREVMSDG